MAAFIASQREQHGVPQAVSCRALGVSQSWFYRWKDGELPPRAARRQRLKAEVARLFAARDGKDGAPRIAAALREAGWRVSENTVAGLMHEQGLAARPAGRAASARPGRGKAGGGHRTWSSGTSRPPGSTASGMATAPRSPPGKASSTSIRSLTWAHAGSSGTRSASTTTRTWRTVRWRWRSRSAAAGARRDLPQRLCRGRR